MNFWHIQNKVPIKLFIIRKKIESKKKKKYERKVIPIEWSNVMCDVHYSNIHVDQFR